MLINFNLTDSQISREWNLEVLHDHFASYSVWRIARVYTIAHYSSDFALERS
jgi:hypothetical protein